MLQVRQRIPIDLREKAVGSTLAIPIGHEEATIRITPKMEAVQVSLRTRDPVEAKVRTAVALAYLNSFWVSLRAGPERLSHKQVVALAGESYREYVARNEDNPGTPEGWEMLKGLEKRMTGSGLQIGQSEPTSPEAPSRLDRLLARYNLAIDEGSRARLKAELQQATREAMARLETNAKGDYSTDKNLGRFPEFKATAKGGEKPSPDASMSSLVEGWWREAKAAGKSPKTYQSYESSVRRLAAFLKHDDARRVRPEDVVAFKDARVEDGISPKTIKDNDLAGIRRVFGWGVTNLRITANPALGVSIEVAKHGRLSRPKGFTDAEALLILRHASGHKQGREYSKTFAAKKWVPWLCAYTGARVGEMAQLRKQDVREEEGHWIIHITPEAGTVKNNDERVVPLHSHLVELGFLELVKKSPGGHLFLTPAKNGEVRGRLQTVKNRLVEFAREVVAEKSVSEAIWRGCCTRRGQQRADQRNTFPHS